MRSNLRPGRFTSEERGDSRWIWVLVGSRADRDVSEKRELTWPSWESKIGESSRQPRHHTRTQLPNGAHKGIINTIIYLLHEEKSKQIQLFSYFSYMLVYTHAHLHKHTNGLSFIADQSEEALSFKKPASAGISCDSCRVRYSDERYGRAWILILLTGFL